MATTAVTDLNITRIAGTDHAVTVAGTGVRLYRFVDEAHVTFVGWFRTFGDAVVAAH